MSILSYLKKAVEKKSSPSRFVQEVKIDYRKNPKFEHQMVLDVLNDSLYEAKLNKRMLEEYFY